MKDKTIRIIKHVIFGIIIFGSIPGIINISFKLATGYLQTYPASTIGEILGVVTLIGIPYWLFYKKKIFEKKK